MDQAITLSLVKLEAESKAALAAGLALGDSGAPGGAKGGAHAGAGKPLATAAKEATLAVQGLVQAIPTVSVPITSQLIPPLAQLAPLFQAATESIKIFGDVSGDAADRSSEAQKRAVAQHPIGLVAAIANRRAAAGIEAVWETAQGFSALGRYDFWGAGEHFLSAAEYGVLAGSGGGRSGGSGAGSSVFSRGEVGRSGSGAAMPPPGTLAPGAAGAGGRFGSGGLTVMVVGEAQAGQWIASTLNRAVDRGVTLNATSSQRGAPVGH
jgi:hypothetical protein